MSDIRNVSFRIVSYRTTFHDVELGLDVKNQYDTTH